MYMEIKLGTDFYQDVREEEKETVKRWKGEREAKEETGASRRAVFSLSMSLQMV